MTYYLLTTITFIHNPSELDIHVRDTTEFFMSSSYLDILLNIDINSKLPSQLYDKWDDLTSPSPNFPYLCSNIPLSPTYGVYVSLLVIKKRCCCRGFNSRV